MPLQLLSYLGSAGDVAVAVCAQLLVLPVLQVLLVMRVLPMLRELVLSYAQSAE